jgi:hypothetical protein
MKSTHIFMSFIPQCTRSLARVWTENALARIEVGLRLKPTGSADAILQDFAEWPRNDSVYRECVSSILDVGLTAPSEAVQALASIIPNTKHQGLYPVILNQLKADVTNPLHKELADFLIYFLYADTVAQLASHTPADFSNSSMLTTGVDLIEKDISKAIDARFRPALEYLCSQLLRQLSVLVSLFTRTEIGYNGAVTYFIAAISAAKKEIEPAKKARHCILWRFIRQPDPSEIPNFYRQHIKGLVEKKEMAPYLPLVIELVRNLVLQMRITVHDKLSDLYKLFTKPDSSIKKTVLEHQAILLARDAECRPEKVRDLFEKAPRDVDNQTVLRAFLYILRGDTFFPNNEFWEWGDSHGGYEVHDEMTQQLFPNQVQTLTDRNCFCAIFTDCIRDRMNNTVIATQILFNLLSRNLTTSFACLVETFKVLLIGDVRTAAFLRAFSYVFHPKSGFVDGVKVTQDQAQTVKEILRQLIEQKLKSYSPPDLSTHAYSCVTVSVQTCPRSISPDDKFKPKGTLFGFELRISQAEKKVKEQLEIKDRLPPSPSVHLSHRFREDSDSLASEKSALYLIALLYEIMTPAEATLAYFLPIVRASVCNYAELAFFALYALQVFYINKPYTAQTILSLVNQSLKNTIGEESSFTLLNLLYQLLSLPRIVLEEKDMGWLTKWAREVQALLLVHLTSPFVEVRDLVLLVLNRFDTMCAGYNLGPTIGGVLSTFKNKIARRATKLLSLHGVKIRSSRGLFFEDAARTHSVVIYLPFLSEYVQALMRAEMKPVLQILWHMTLWDRIDLPVGAGHQVVNEPEMLFRVLPIMTVVNRFIPLRRETQQLIILYLPLIDKGTYLTDYKVGDGLLIHAEGEQDICRPRVEFVESTLPQLVNLMLSDSSWAFTTLITIASGSTIELIGVILSKLVDFFGRTYSLPQSNRLILLMRCIAQSPDLRLISATQSLAMRLLFKDFFPWCHASLLQHDYRVEEMKCDAAVLARLVPFLQSYCKCVESFVQVFNTVRDPGTVGPLRGSPVPPWITLDCWSAIDCRCCLQNLVALVRSPVCDEIGAFPALESLLRSAVLFDKQYPITQPLYDLFCQMEAKNMKVLRNLLFHHHSDLFLEFVSMAILRPSAEGHYFFLALASQYDGDDQEFNLSPLANEDKEATSALLGVSGILVLLSFLLLAGAHKESRRVAYNLLRRISPIFGAWMDCKDLLPAAAINSYLEHHRGFYSAAFPPTPEELFALSLVYAENMPFLTHRVFYELTKCFLDGSNLLKGDPHLITTLLNAVAPFARNANFSSHTAFPDDFHTPSSFTPYSLVQSLIARFALLNKTSHLAYARIFSEMCSKPENVFPLVQILVISSANQADVTAIQTICLYLVQTQAAPVLQLLTQPLTFGSWFNSNVMRQSPHNWLKLSLNVLREVAQSNFAFLFPYIHTIIHYCLLFLNDDALEVRLLFDAIMSSLAPKFEYPPNVRISFTSSETATAIPIATIVGEISGKLFLAAIPAWSRDALQWAACCGDLSIASKSCLVYASVLNSLSLPDAMPLIRAVDVILTAPSSQSVMQAQVTPYIRGVLQALGSIVDRAAAQNATSLLFYVFDFASHFLSLASVDFETANAALQVLSLFLSTTNQTPAEQLAPRMLGIAKMLHGSFNEGSVLRFLTSVIVNLAPAVSQTLKVVALALLLPCFFAVVSAYHSVDPYSTFIEDNLVAQTFNAARAIANAEFAGDSRYSEILAQYFEDNAQALARDPPDVFIDELTREMWQSDSAELATLGRFYAEIARMGSGTVNCAIFSVSRSFVQTAPDKASVCRIFADVAQVAIASPEREARDFLGTFGVHSPSDLFDGAALTAQPPPPGEAAIIAATARAIHEATQCSHSALFANEPLVLQGAGCVIPMIPLFAQKDAAAGLRDARILPFVEQDAFWKEEKAAVAGSSGGRVERMPPTPFELYAHGQATTEAVQKAVELRQETGIQAQAFILKDDELGDFEMRVQ